MRNLLNFIVRYATWLVFAFYVILSLLLLTIGNRYHQYVYLTSANTVSGSLFKLSSSVTGYFGLKTINEGLQANNAKLQNEVLNLKSQIASYKALLSDTLPALHSSQRYGYIVATVINNNTRHPKNYFTIDKGKVDGIEPGMGIVDQNGIVGIVNVVSDHMSRVTSLLNESQNFSVKIKNSSYVGSLNWKSGNPNIAYLIEIPRHAKYHIGDTIVTSGYSTTFPEGIPAGTILNRVKTNDDSFFTFKVKLLPNFQALTTVRIITDIHKEELDSLSNSEIDQLVK